MIWVPDTVTAPNDAPEPSDPYQKPAAGAPAGAIPYDVVTFNGANSTMEVAGTPTPGVDGATPPVMLTPPAPEPVAAKPLAEKVVVPHEGVQVKEIVDWPLAQAEMAKNAASIRRLIGPLS